jgi:hypothetical protein
VNGRTTTRDFPSGTDDSFTATVELVDTTSAEIRLTIVLLAEADSGDSLAAANISVLSIDANFRKTEAGARQAQ